MTREHRTKVKDEEFNKEIEFGLEAEFASPAKEVSPKKRPYKKWKQKLVLVKF